MPPSGWTDRRVEVILGGLLRAGVLLAAAVILIGGAIYLARHGGEPPSYGTFKPGPEELRRLAGILRKAAVFQGPGVIQLGFLLLIATPVARVAFSVFAFTRERDWLYVAITLVVLFVLLHSLAGGFL